MTHLDLFAGIGGFAVAAQWVWGENYKNVGHSEIDEYCCKVYHRHFPTSPCLGDIRKIKWIGVRGGAELITGGFPCQPYSVAGKRRGKADDRALWLEMFRAIRAIRPTWVVAENVTGIINMELDDVLFDLESEGYEAQAFVIPACAVGAPHRRDRVWIVGHANHARCNESQNRESSNQGGNSNAAGQNQIWQSTGSTLSRNLVANAYGKYSEEPERGDKLGQAREETASRRSIYEPSWEEHWAEVATRLCRMDDGLSNRVDRLRALGNAIVPQVAFVILDAIRQLESEQA